MNRIQTIGGVNVTVSPLAIRRVSVRKHKDRGEIHTGRLFRGGAVYRPSAYHLRIQKKWDKRFGVKDEPCILHVNSHVLGIGLSVPRPSLVVHPDLWDKVKKALEQNEGGRDP